jgi:hypothetical protein
MAPGPAPQSEGPAPDATTAPAASASQQARPQFVEDQYIVTFRDGAPPGLVGNLTAQHGITARHTYSNVLSGFSATIPPAAVTALRNHPFVESIEPVSLFYLEESFRPGTVQVPAAGLRLRLVADELGLADGADVDQWANFGGSEGSATQSRRNRRPTFHAAGSSGLFGGRAHVGFNEAGQKDEYLQVTNVDWHGSATLVAVFSQDDKAAHNYGLFAVYGSTSNRGTFASMFAGGGDPLGYWDATLGQHRSTFSPTANTEHVAVWRIDGGNTIDFQVDGVSYGSFPITSDMHDTFNRYFVGNATTSRTNPFTGQIAELVMYDRALVDCERDGLVGAYGAHYGIDVGAVGGGACAPPSPPKSLTALAIDHQSVDLAWTDMSANEDGFDVERREGQNGTFAVIAQTAPDATAYSDAGLLASTEYCYRVSAFNADGSSAPTGIECVTTPAGPPPPPPPPPVSVPDAGLRLRLVADQLGLADGADVDVWPNSGGSVGDPSQSTLNEQPTFHAGSPSGLFDGHAHVGFNESGSRQHLDVGGVPWHGSATLVAVFAQDDKAAHNYGIVGVYGSTNNRGTFATMFSGGGDQLGYWDFTLNQQRSTFSPTAGQEHVAVWRIAGSDFIDFQVDGVSYGTIPITSDMHHTFSRYLIGTNEPSSTNTFDGQIAELLIYDRALLDCERDGIVANLGGQYGVDVGGVASGACSPPAAPSGLTATAISHDTIDLGWTDGSSDEDGFTVERRVGQSGTFDLLVETAANVTAYSDTDVLSDTEYCYRVRSFNGDGISAYTPVECATTSSGPPPPPPPSPVDAPSQGLRLRLVADELGLPDGAAVDTWPNFGGTVGDVSQTDPSEQPAYRAAGSDGSFAGRASVSFNENGSGQYLEASGVEWHGSATLVAVFQQADKTAHNYGILGLYGSLNNRGTFATMFTGGGDELGYWDFTLDQHRSTFSPTAGQQHVAVWRIDGSDFIDFQVDGVDRGSVPITEDMHYWFDRYLVGSNQPSSTNTFDGRIAELMIYDRPLLDCERDGLVADLGTRYGVDVGTIGGGACNPPAAPVGLTATAPDYRTVDLSWADVSADEYGFRLERSTGGPGAFDELAEFGPNATAYTDTTVIALTEYCYRVFAYNGDGDSESSNVECVTPPAPPPGVCFDTGNHDDLGQLWNIQRIQADQNEQWQASQLPGCDMKTWIFILDSGLDSDHPDLNVAATQNFVVAEAGNTGEDGNGHGTHVAGIAAAIDGNGGQEDDILAAIDAVTAVKLANPGQPMVANMSIAGAVTPSIDTGLRASVNAGVVYAVGAGNGLIGACFIPGDAQDVSPAGVGDDEINSSNGSDGNTARVNGVITVTLSTSADADGDCNYGNPVTVAAPGANVYSAWLNGGYATNTGTSMSSPHGAGAAALYLQVFPNATPAEVEAWIMSRLDPWTTDDLPNADGRLNVRNP